MLFLKINRGVHSMNSEIITRLESQGYKPIDALKKADVFIAHFDGNNNDPDDISALPMHAALADAAGLNNKLTMFYGNNLGEPSVSQKEELMRNSASFASSLGIKTYDYQENIDQTTTELVKILNSGKKVLSFEGGPMEAIYRALQKTNSNNLANITLLSHSHWNENRDSTSKSGINKVHTWSDIRKDFPNVTLIEMQDQNGNPDNAGFNSSEWNWLNNTKNSALKAARAAMNNAGGEKTNDPSDAGMLFYALTGNDRGNPYDARDFFDKLPPAYDSQPSPAPAPAPQPTPPAAPGSQSDKVFLANNGQVVIEAENTKLQGDWEQVTVDGEKSVLWDANQSSYGGVPKGQTLSYKFETDESGQYNIALHSARLKRAMGNSELFNNGNPRSDTGNDAYVAVVEQSTGKVVRNPTKLFTSLGNSDGDLKWGNTFDANHKKSSAQVNLKDNTQYRLEISGRSDGYVLDRITLSNDGVLKNTSLPQSPTKGSSPSPQPAPAPAPPAPVPTPEPAPPAPAPQPTPPNSSGSLLKLSLVDANTKKVVVEDLGKYPEVALNNLDLDRYSVFAQVNPNHSQSGSVKSIKFESAQSNRVENVAPYALFGDHNGVVFGRDLKPGDYKIKATAYAQGGAKGNAIQSTGLNYTVVDAVADAVADAPLPASDSLIRFSLVNAKTKDIVVEDLGANSNIELGNLDLDKFSVFAQLDTKNPKAKSVESIKFESSFGGRVESVAPYALFGDSNGMVYGRDLISGDHKIKATAYSRDGARGEAIEALNLNFMVDGDQLKSSGVTSQSFQAFTDDNNSLVAIDGGQSQAGGGAMNGLTA